MLVDASSYVLNQANNEFLEVASRSNPSVLRQRSFDGLSSESWMQEVIKEMITRCPMAYQILAGFLQNSIYPEKKNPALCLIYGIIMFLRSHELSRIQRINSVLLIQGQASVNVSTVIFFTVFY